MEEILSMYFEIKNSGIEKQPIAGGAYRCGAQLKHLKQLVEYTTV